MAVITFLDGDTLVFIDFRADRMRQIVEAFGIKPQFETDKIPKDIVSDSDQLRKDQLFTWKAFLLC
jgi:bisphosphoglycerate-independent phosphoglycerate mutase (AlkP superfamily)